MKEELFRLREEIKETEATLIEKKKELSERTTIFNQTIKKEILELLSELKRTIPVNASVPIEVECLECEETFDHMIDINDIIEAIERLKV